MNGKCRDEDALRVTRAETQMMVYRTSAIIRKLWLRRDLSGIFPLRLPAAWVFKGPTYLIGSACSVARTHARGLVS